MQPPAAGQELVQHAIPIFGEYRLGMELYTDNRVSGMVHGQDLPVFACRGAPRLAGHRFWSDHQVVITGREECARQAGEDPFSPVMDPGCLAVHWPFCAYDLSAVRRNNALVAQAYAEDRNRAAESLDQLRGDSRFSRGAGPRADDDVAPLGGTHLIRGGPI